MRPSLISSSLFLITSFPSRSTALEALTNSPCAVQCGNDLGGTSGSDIVCPDSSYTSTSAGQTFQSCVTCQLSSTYVDPVTNQTDLQWGLYNLRYAMSWCLFGFPNNTAIGDSPCIIGPACGLLQSSIEFDSLSPNATEYSYCASMLGSPSIAKCSACLIEQSDEYYLNNFLTALNAACEQQPASGSTISIQGSLFSTTPVNITSPTQTPSGVNYNTGGLTLGAKIGIVVGAVILILITLGFCIIWNGKRRRRAILRKVQQESGYDNWRKQQDFGREEGGPQKAQRESGYDDWRKHHDFSTEDGGVRGGSLATHPTPPMDSSPYFDSPDSQRPLHHAWSARPVEEDSPITTVGEKAYFSPYTSNYSSPVSASDQIPPFGKEWPVERKTSLHSPNVGRDWPVEKESSIATGLGRDRLRSRSRDKKEKNRDGGVFEMQNVAPVLMHPGHGRGNSSGSVALTEEDARRGSAL